MIKPDGVMIKPNGVVIQPSGVIYKPNGVTVKPDGVRIKHEGITVNYDGVTVKPDVETKTVSKSNSTPLIKPDDVMIKPGDVMTASAMKHDAARQNTMAPDQNSSCATLLEPKQLRPLCEVSRRHSDAVARATHRLLAADVGARPAVHVNVEVVARVTRVLPDQSSLVRLKHAKSC